MKQPQPVLVIHLFPELLDALVALLSDLSPEDWPRPTTCPSWSVKDVALHLLGGDIGILSQQRDGCTAVGEPLQGWNDLVTLVNTMNAQWVAAAQRMSPRLVRDLLQFTGTQVSGYFASRDPHALGGPVSWAGPDPAPVWLDLAREYTERWHHQQHIRDAVGKPGLTEARYLAPVLDTFMRALPYTYRTIAAHDGMTIAVTINGEMHLRRVLLRQQNRWELYVDAETAYDAELVLPAHIAWRVWTKGIRFEQAQQQATLHGDRQLALPALKMVSIIA